MSGSNPTDKNSPTPNVNKTKPNLLIEQLEDRVLFDAVPVPVDAAGVEETMMAQFEAITEAFTADDSMSKQQQAQTSSEVVFVDKTVEGFADVVADFANNRDVDVFFITGGSDGLEQIANHLEGRSDLSAIHIVSHGSDGQLFLGNTVVESSDLQSEYAAELVRIGQSLGENGDILIYGCDLAGSAEGEKFVEKFSELTGADVAASDDVTGSADQGGDWTLEKQVGQVETSALSSARFQGTLLESDAGFIIGTSPVFADGEIAIVPEGEVGTSSFLYSGAATANSGAIVVDVQLTLVNTFDQNGNETTGEPNQLPVTFGNWDGSPVLLSRIVGASVAGYQGHTAEIRVDFFEQDVNGNPGDALSIVGDFTFKDIDFVAGTGTGAGNEAVTILSDEMRSFSVSDDPASDIDTIDNGDGTTTFTNDSSNGDPDDEDRWIGISFHETISHTLIFKARNGHTGYGLSTENFTNPATNNLQPVAEDDDFETDQNTVINGNVVTADNQNGIDSDPDGDPLSVSLVGGLSANVGTGTTGSNGGEFTINANGTYSFDPNGDFDYLAAGATATTTITYQINDGNGLADDATVTVVVTGTNDAPVVSGSIPNQNNPDATTPAAVDAAAAFTDVDGAMTFSAAGLPAGLSIDSATGLITGTIDNSASQGGLTNNGDYTVTVTATDGAGLSTQTTFAWTVTNPGPTATANSGSVTENTSLTDSGNVISDNDGSGVDSDPDGDTLTVSAVDGVAGDVGSTVTSTYGSIVINTNGTYTYTLDNDNATVNALDNGESLTETFAYTVTDSEGGTSTANLTITINGTNDQPIVGGTIPNQSDLDDDSVTTVDVTSAFSDPDGDTLTYTATGLPVGLTLDLDSGEITGQIDNSASQGGTGGVYTVEVTATDDNGASVATTFTWTVANPGPTATNNSADVTEDSALTDSGNVITNNDGSGVDSDPDGDALSIGAVDGNAANVGVSLTGSYGSVVLNSNGTYTYTLDNNNSAVNALDNGDNLTDSFTYTLIDGEGGSSTATLSVTINGTNDAPTVTGTIPNQINVDLQTSISVDVTDAFTDVDDALSYAITGLPAGLTLNPSIGLITGTIDNSASQGGTGGVYTVEVTATDDNGASTKTTFTWTVTNPGPNATDNTAEVTEETSLTDSGNVIANNDGSGVDSDPDGDALTVSAVDGVAGDVGSTITSTYGSIVINTTGTYTYTLDNDNAAVNALDNGETLSETFSYTISDGEGGTSTADLTITINGTNDQPVAGGTIPNQSDLDAETVTTVDVTSAFSDPDGDTLTYTATGLPAGLTLDLNTGEITGQVDNSASQGGTGGAYTVEVTATDDNGATVATTFIWTVANPGPTATANNGSVTENTSLTDSGSVITDNDGSGVDSDPDGDTLTVSAVDGVAGDVGSTLTSTYGSIIINTNGTYTYTLDNDNATVNALDNGESLTETFSYTVTDSEGGTSTADLTITINGTNDQPIVGGTIPNQSDLDDDSVTTVDVTSAFSDPDGDTLTYSATGLPAGLTLDLNTGEITGQIDNSASQGGTGGVYTVEVTATDDNGASVATTFTWTVANPGPSATANSGTVTENTSLTDSGNVITNNDGSGVDNDPDGDALTVSAVDGVAGDVGSTVTSTYGSIVINTNGTYTYTLDNDNATVNALDNGETLTETFSYTVTDSEGGTSTADLTITIDGTNDQPIAGGTIPNQSDLDADTVTTVDVTSAFSDPEGDTLTYTATGLPAGLTLDLNTGEITGQIDNSASQGGTGGVYTVEVTATDDNGASVATTFTWTVANPGPTATANSGSVTENTSLTDGGNVITNNDGSGTDSDPDGDALTVSAIDGVAGDVGVNITSTYGSIVISSNGTYTYTLDNDNANVNALDNGETLTETFSYAISDGEGGTSTADLTITINGTNDQPVAGGTIPNQSDLDDDTVTTVDVTSTFSDPDGDTLTYAATGLPAGLTLDLNTGEITGQIDNSASQGGTGGVYTVEVTATDDNGASVATTFTWTVANPGPTATANSGSVTENTSLTDSGSVITDNDGSGVDSDPDGDALTVSAVDGVAGDVGSTLTSTYGSIVINTTGTYTYTLDNDNATINALDNGETLTETFSYTVTDSEGGTSTADLTITINGTNDQPIAGGTIPNQSDLDAETVTTVDVTSAFSDPDGDTLTYTATGLPAGLTLDLNTGEITGQVDNSASQGGTGGVYTVEVTATDDNGASVATTFTWTVGNPGPNAVNDFDSTTESALTSGNVITNLAGLDTDVDGDLITVDAVEGTQGFVGSSVAGDNGGEFTINSNGSYSFDPNGDFDSLAAGETATTSVTYTITDSEGGTDTATLEITINGENDDPTRDGTIPNQVDEDASTITTVDTSDYFADGDTSDVLTYSVTGLPAGLTIDSTSGEITGLIDNDASTGGPAGDGVYSVTVTADDGNGGMIGQTFTWTVTNPAPVAETDVLFTDQSTSISGDAFVANFFPDADSDPDGDAIHVSHVGNVTGYSPAFVGVDRVGDNGGVFNLNSDGTFTFDPDGDFDNLAAGETAQTLIRYIITDSDGAQSSSAALVVEVTGTNDAPIANGTIPDQDDLDNETISTVNVSSYFNDIDNSSSLTFSASGLPDGLSIDAAGNITGTIDNSESLNGPFTVIVTATDEHGAEVDQAFTWNVSNPGPVANNDTGSTDEDTSTSGNVITASDSDPDGDSIIVNTVNGSPAGVASPIAGTNGGLFTINSDGSYSFDPNGQFEDLANSETRDTVVTYTITDSEGGTATATLTITVNGANDAPTSSGTIPDQVNVDADSGISLDIHSHFSDADLSDALIFSAVDLPTGLSIDPSTGIISGTIDNSASQDGPFNVTITATDPLGVPTSLSFDWTVTNPGPTATDNVNTINVGGPTTGSGNVVTDNDGSGVDSDPDGDALGVSAFDSSAANVGVSVTGTYGSIVLDSNGDYTYTLDSDNTDVITLGGGDSLTETFTYTVNDSEGGTSSANLTITINGQNDIPVVGGTIPPQDDLDADTIPTLDVSTYFSDPDGDTLTYTASGLPAGLTLDLNSGEITGTIDNSASTGGPLSDGVHTVTITADDGNGGTIETTFEWTVSNPAPTATANTNSVTEDAAINTAAGNVISDNDGSGVDSDPDGDTLTVNSFDGAAGNVGISVAGTYGDIVLNSNGTYTYTVDNTNSDVNALDNGETLTESFTYSVTDDEGGAASSTLTITIDGANDAPVTGGTIPAQSDIDDEAITSVNVTSAFSDPDGDTLTYSAAGLPTGLTFNPNTGIISGTPDNSASQGGPLDDGIYTVDITATDDNGATVTSTFTWTIANPAPTATDNTGSVTEDVTSTTSGNLITENNGFGVDSDPDGDALTVSAFNGTASYGSIVNSSDGTYTYTLDNNNADVNGLDNGETLTETFTYTVTDSEGGTSDATLTITINGTNDAPIAGGTIPPQVDQDADTITTVDVKSAFSDPDGDTLTYTTTDLPAGLSLDPDTGLITGAIDNSASQSGVGGVYTVEITATDDNGESVATTFTWTVSNPGPTATDNTGSVTEDAAINSDAGNVITDNDGFGVDTDQDLDALTVASVAGSAANVGVTVAGTYGSLELNNDGTYTYTLDNDNAAVNTLDVGEMLTDSFTYTVTDSEGGTAAATLTITVDGANDQPVAGGTIPDQANDDADAITTVDVTSAFSDADGDTLTYTATGLPTGLTLDLNSGEITGQVDNSASQAGVSGVYTVEVTATDDNGAAVSTTFEWTVANPGPSAADDFDSTTESALTSGNVITNLAGTDTDVDGDEITVNAVDGSAAGVTNAVTGSNGGEFTINSDGSYSFDPNGDFDSLAAGESATTSVTYTITDSEGGTATATLKITINGENDDPTLVGTIPGQVNVDADTVATLDTSSYFADGDATDDITYSASGLPAGLIINPSSGEIIGQVDNSASQGGPLGDGVHTVTVTANDGNGGTVDQTFTWTVTNPGPDAIDDTGSTDQNTNISGNVTALDTDPDGDTITVNAVNGVSGDVGEAVDGDNGGQFVVDSNGSFSFVPNGDFDYLADGETATTSITYSITDSEGGTDSATLTITVTGTNDTPITSGTIPDQNGVDGNTIAAVDVSPFFADTDTTDSLTYTATGLPAGLSMNSAGVITGTIDNSESQNGPFTITVTAMDSTGAIVQQDFDWNVTNPGPTATNNTGTVMEDTQTTETGNVVTDDDGFGADSDDDNDALEVSAVEGVAGNVGIVVNGTYGTINIDANGSYSYVLNNNHNDVNALDNGDTLSETFSYTITDNEGGLSTADVTITIVGSNDAPVTTSSIPDQANVDNQSIPTLDISSHFADSDDVPTFSATGLPTGLSIAPNGEITGTIDNSASQDIAGGVFTVTVKATDDNGAATSSTFEWVITNPAPTALDNTGSVTETTSLTSSGNVITDNDGLGLDNDPDADELQISAVDGDAADVNVAVDGDYGTITIDSDGGYTYTLDNDNSDVAALDNNETLTDSFTYTITDGEGGISAATLDITINGTNNAPVVGSTIPNQADVDSLAITSLDVSPFFTDADDAPTFSATGLPSGLSINAAGMITGTPDSSASAGGTDGVYSVTVTATDDNGESVSTTFDWTITNPTPTAGDDDFTTDEDITFSDTVVGNDADADDSVTYNQLTDPANGTVTFYSNGTFDYTPDSDFHGTDSFTYEIVDADGATETATVTIEVDSVNDDPNVLSAIPAQTNLDADTINTSIASHFDDVDGDGLTFSASGLPTGLSIDAAGNITGEIDNSASLIGTFSVTVTASDEVGGTTDQTFTWTVSNPGPTAFDNATLVTEDSQPVSSGNVITNASPAGLDSDQDNDDLTVTAVNGNTAQVSVAVTGAYGTIQINADGSYVYTLDNDNVAVDSLDNGETLMESFDYQISDGEGGFSTATLVVDINGQNDSPIVGATLPNQTNLDADNVVSVDVSTAFSDVDGDALTYDVTGLPAGLSFDPNTGVVSGEIDNNASTGGLLSDGVYSIEVTATDDNGQAVTTTFDWTVANHAPTADDDGFTTDEDTAFTASVTSNDGDVDADIVSYAVTNGPSNGELTFNPNGSFTYTPDADFFGNDTFDYEICDEDGDCAAATVTVTVDSINDEPVVDSPVPDRENADSDVIALDISSNFSDPEGDNLTFTATGLPPGLSIDAAGNVTGTLDSSASVVGAYTVVITAQDPTGDTVTDTFTWTVTNPAPQATNDSYSTDEDIPFSGDASSLDSDPDGDVLSFAHSSEPANGTLDFNPNGTFTYTPDPGFNGHDSFNYVAIDADGAQTPATVFISIGAVNDLPTIVSPIADQANLDADNINIDVSTSFSDPEGDTLTFTATGLPPGLSIDADGNITGAIDKDASQSGPYTVVVTANDGNLGEITDTFTWIVDNPAPDATDDDFTTDEDIPFTDSIAGNDSDPDNDGLTFALTSGPMNGALTFNDDGSFTYSPDGDFFGQDSFDYEACDADGDCTTATVTITIDSVNDAPTATLISNQANLDSEATSVDVSSHFSDIDGGTLSYSAIGLPPGLTIDPNSGVISGTIDIDASQNGPYAVTVTADDGQGESVGQFFTWTIDNPAPLANNDPFTTDEDTSFNATVAGNDSDPDGDATTFTILAQPLNGSVVFNDNGTFSYTPNTDFHGIDTFDYEICDADGAFTTASVTITVEPVNDKPTVSSPLQDQTDFDADTISVDAASAFNDVESNSLTFSATGLPPGLSIDSATGLISGTIDVDASTNGPYTVTVTADDGFGGTATDTFSWNVNNHLPTAEDDSFTTNEDVPFSDSVAPNDSDVDDAVTFTLLNTPDNGMLTFNADGTFDYEPNAGYNGYDSFDYEICDADGDCAIATATIAIGAVNDPPEVTNPLADQSDLDADAVVVDVSNSFSDTEGDSLTYSATGLPPGLALNPVTGIITGMIDTVASTGGPYTVTITADDGNGGTMTDTFTWNIGNPGPIAVNDSYTTSEDTPFSNTVANNDSDPDGDSLTFTTLTDPLNGTVAWNTDGTFTYTPDAEFHGTDSFTYQVTDSDGSTATALATVTVDAVNDPPVANDDSATTAEDTSVSIGVIGNDSDPDSDPLTVSIVNGPANGTVSMNLDGTIEYTPNENFFGTDTFEYSITDPTGNSSTAMVTIDVTSENDAPIAVDDEYMTSEDITLVGNVGTNDIDVDDTGLTFSLHEAPTTGTLVFNADGTFIYEPVDDFNGQVTFEYCVEDSLGQTDIGVATIDVLPVNDLPTAADDDETTSQNQSVFIDLVVNDSDLEDAVLTVTKINGVPLNPGEKIELPSGAVVTLNGDGTVSFDPNGAFDELTQGESAIESFEYTVRDGEGGLAKATAFVTINGENDAPVTEDDFIKTTVDTSVTVSVLGNDYDPEKEPLSVVLLNQPVNGTATVNPDGTITYVPDEAYEGIEHIHYLVEDPHGATDDATLTIEVEPDFRFDAFTNFSQSTSTTHMVDQVELSSRRVLSQKIFSLAPEPIFSGYARPGTQIVGRIYDASGALVGQSSAYADPGGNWLMQMSNTKGFQFHRIEFEQVASTGGSDIYGYFGLNPADNSYQAMEALTSYDKPLSVSGAMTTSSDTLSQSHQSSNNPLGFGR